MCSVNSCTAGRVSPLTMENTNSKFLRYKNNFNLLTLKCILNIFILIVTIHDYINIRRCYLSSCSL